MNGRVLAERGTPPSAAQSARIFVVRITPAGQTATAQDDVAIEAPLQIVLDGENLSMTMRTPGHDAELALGLLYAEGLLTGCTDIASVKQEGPDRVHVRRTPETRGKGQAAPSLDRRFMSSSACGVCGKQDVDDIVTETGAVVAGISTTVSATTLQALPTALRAAQAIFDHTGGLHAAALFDTQGRLLRLREDVGRHNALDKLMGAGLRSGPPAPPDSVLLLSGRASFELVQKAIAARLAICAAIGAPSSAAVQMAAQAGMTLVGFLRPDRFNIYSGAHRITL